MLSCFIFKLWKGLLLRIPNCHERRELQRVKDIFLLDFFFFFFCLCCCKFDSEIYKRGRGGGSADLIPKDLSMKTIQVCEVFYIMTYDILNPRCPVVCAFYFLFFFTSYFLSNAKIAKSRCRLSLVARSIKTSNRFSLIFLFFILMMCGPPSAEIRRKIRGLQETKLWLFSFNRLSSYKCLLFRNL